MRKLILAKNLFVKILYVQYEQLIKITNIVVDEMVSEIIKVKENEKNKR